MRVHLVQLDIQWEQRDANHARVRALLDSARPTRGDLIVLPEMFDSGFSLNVQATHDGTGETRRFVEELARSSGCTVHGSQTILAVDGMGRNRALVIGPDGEELAAYDKVHPFSFGRESERFAGGTEIATYRWAGESDALTVCPAVCYDLRFPELFRAGVDRGAQAFVVGANWPDARQDHWRALAIARAIENQAWFIGVNRAGQDPHLDYAGGSLVVDPRGTVVGEAGPHEHVLSVAVDSERLEAWRAEFPALRDRRPGVYRAWADGDDSPCRG